MLEFFIDTEYGRANRRTFKVVEYMRSLKERCDLYAVRHMRGYGSRNSVLDAFDMILGAVDYDQLRSMSSDYDRYNRYIEDMEPIFIQMLMDNRYTKVWTDAMVESRNVIESVVPINCTNYFSSLPMNKPFDKWLEIYPLRVIAHDSLEYTINVDDDRITFRKDPPGFVLFGIDIPTLILKYFHYQEENPGDDNRNIFLHRHVTVGLMYDLQDLWVRNRTAELIKGQPTALDPNNYPYDSTYNYIGQQYDRLVESVAMIKELLSNGNMIPKDALNSLAMPGPVYYSDWVKTRLDTMVTRQERQYLWIGALRDIYDIGILADLHEETIDRPTSTRFRSYIKRRLDRYEANNIWSYPHPAIGGALKRTFTDIYNRLSL